MKAGRQPRGMGCVLNEFKCQPEVFRGQKSKAGTQIIYFVEGNLLLVVRQNLTKPASIFLPGKDIQSSRMVIWEKAVYNVCCLILLSFSSVCSA